MGGDDGEVSAMVRAADFLLAAGVVRGGFVSAGMAVSTALSPGWDCGPWSAGTGGGADFPAGTFASRNLRNARIYASHS